MGCIQLIIHISYLQAVFENFTNQDNNEHKFK